MTVLTGTPGRTGGHCRLEHEGLVEHGRHRGSRVRLVELSEAVEIQEARAVLGDADAAEDAMRTHLSHIADALRRSQPT